MFTRFGVVANDGPWLAFTEKVDKAFRSIDKFVSKVLESE